MAVTDSITFSHSKDFFTKTFEKDLIQKIDQNSTLGYHSWIGVNFDIRVSGYVPISILQLYIMGYTPTKSGNSFCSIYAQNIVDPANAYIGINVSGCSEINSKLVMTIQYLRV